MISLKRRRLNSRKWPKHYRASAQLWLSQPCLYMHVLHGTQAHKASSRGNSIAPAGLASDELSAFVHMCFSIRLCAFGQPTKRWRRHGDQLGKETKTPSERSVCAEPRLYAFSRVAPWPLNARHASTGSPSEVFILEIRMACDAAFLKHDITVPRMPHRAAP